MHYFALWYDALWQAWCANSRLYWTTVGVFAEAGQSHVEITPPPSRASHAIERVEESRFGGHQVIVARFR